MIATGIERFPYGWGLPYGSIERRKNDTPSSFGLEIDMRILYVFVRREMGQVPFRLVPAKFLSRLSGGTILRTFVLCPFPSMADT